MVGARARVPSRETLRAPHGAPRGRADRRPRRAGRAPRRQRLRAHGDRRGARRARRARRHRRRLSAAARHPLRRRVLGDDIESIRDFDPASQRSQGKLAHWSRRRRRGAALRPRARDRRAAIRFATLADSEGLPPATVDALIDDLLRGHRPPGVEALAPLLDPASRVACSTTCPRTRSSSSTIPRRVANAGGATTKRRATTSRARSRPGGWWHRRATLLAPEASVPDALVGPARRAARTPWPMPRTKRIATSSTCAATKICAAASHARAPTNARSRRWRITSTDLREDGWRVILAVRALSAAERLRDLLGEYGVNRTTAGDPRPLWCWSRPGRVEVRVAAFSRRLRAARRQARACSPRRRSSARAQKRRERARAGQDGAAVEGPRAARHPATSWCTTSTASASTGARRARDQRRAAASCSASSTPAATGSSCPCTA